MLIERASREANTRGRQRKQGFLLSALFKICAITGCVALGKSLCNRILRAPSVLAFFYQNANAKSEFVYFREKMSKATASRPFRVAGIQRALSPLARFFRHFLPRSKKWHQSRTAHAQRCVRVRRRSRKKFKPYKQPARRRRSTHICQTALRLQTASLYPSTQTPQDLP